MPVQKVAVWVFDHAGPSNENRFTIILSSKRSIERILTLLRMELNEPRKSQVTERLMTDVL